MSQILLLLVICFTFLVLIRNIRVGFGLIILLRIMILPSISLSLGPANILLTHITTIILFFAFFIHQYLKKQREEILNKHILDKTIIIFILANFALIFFSSFNVGLISQIKYIGSGLIMQFLVCYVIWYIYNTREEITQFANIIALASIFLFLYGIFCYLTMSNPYISFVESTFGMEDSVLRRMEEIRGGLEGRIQGTMQHALTWGGTCYILFCFFMSNGVIKSNRLMLLLCSLALINLFLSGSRSVLLALIISLVTYFFFVGKAKRIKIIKYSFLVLPILLILVFISGFWEKYQVLIESTLFFWDDSLEANSEIKGSSTSMRLEQLLYAIFMVKDSLLGGLGHGYVIEYQQSEGFHPILLGFESLVLQKLVDNGILGLLLWLLFFAALFFLPRKIKKKNKESKESSAVLCSYISGYLVFSLLTGFMNTFPLFLYFYTIMLKNIVVNSNNVTQINQENNK